MDSHITFDANVANLGSAIALANILPSDESLHDLVITNNTALQGGTIYWLYGRNNISVEPAGLNSPTINWGHNNALYGTKYATQAILILMDPYTVTDYNTQLSPPPEAYLYDYYGSRLLKQDTAKCNIEACDANDDGCIHNCNGFTAYGISGQVEITSQNGSLTWDSIVASCYPTGNFNVSISGIVQDTDYFGLLKLDVSTLSACIYVYGYMNIQISQPNIPPCYVGC